MLFLLFVSPLGGESGQAQLALGGLLCDQRPQGHEAHAYLLFALVALGGGQTKSERVRAAWAVRAIVALSSRKVLVFILLTHHLNLGNFR